MDEAENDDKKELDPALFEEADADTDDDEVLADDVDPLLHKRKKPVVDDPLHEHDGDESLDDLADKEDEEDDADQYDDRDDL